MQSDPLFCLLMFNRLELLINERTFLGLNAWTDIFIKVSVQIVGLKLRVGTRWAEGLFRIMSDHWVFWSASHFGGSIWLHRLVCVSGVSGIISLPYLRKESCKAMTKTYYTFIFASKFNSEQFVRYKLSELTEFIVRCGFCVETAL